MEPQSSTHFQSINPHTGTIIASYPIHSPDEIADSLNDLAKQTMIWRQTSLEDRTKLLSSLADNLLSQEQRFAELITTEMGKPLHQSLQEIRKCASLCTYYASHAKEHLAPAAVQCSHGKAEVLHEPLGTVLAIMPWNFPFWQVFRCAIPALISGNGVILKHAPNVAGCADAIALLCSNAGIRAFKNLRTDLDGVSLLIKSDQVSAISLTGSEAAGQSVASQSGAALKKCVLELGGSDPYIILEDADLVEAAEVCINSRLQNSGQTCIAAKRFIAVESVYDEFVEHCLARLKKQVIGDPASPTTTVGPLARRDLLQHLKSQVARSLEGGNGCKLIFESPVPEPYATRGFYHPILALEGAEPGSPAFDDELFGPVCVFVKAANQAEALQLANHTRFGLGAAIFTKQLSLGKNLASKRILAGCVAVNRMVASFPELPFGGIAHSGYGRELGREGMLEFTNCKTILLP